MFYVTNATGGELGVIFAHEKTKINFKNKFGKTESQVKPVSTTCKIVTDDAIKGVGVAKCHPDDNFSYKEGRKMALTRALENANIPSNTRTMVWSKYFEHINE